MGGCATEVAAERLALSLPGLEEFIRQQVLVPVDRPCALVREQLRSGPPIERAPILKPRADSESAAFATDRFLAWFPKVLEKIDHQCRSSALGTRFEEQLRADVFGHQAFAQMPATTRRR